MIATCVLSRQWLHHHQCSRHPEENRRMHEINARAAIADRPDRQDGPALSPDDLKTALEYPAVAADQDRAEAILARPNGGAAWHFAIDRACVNELVALSGTL